MRRKSNLSLDLFGDRLNVPTQTDDDGAERKKMLRVLRSAMEGELTERQKACVRLRYFEEKSVSEVAEILGVTPSTASKHLKKARARLGKIMGYSFPRLS
ncbi:MAG: sigma-70 family RNA polymerase sigma factor [Clostridiales bacterium]|jgi:RNA polymerase sigma factor (sigma-70 family)|nr:sigma-70 family RNA polymerase sigma factor [Clostridiales bacterium]